MPPFPCHSCREKSAKKGCSYRFCASCCRNCSNSVCGVHGTGFEASQERVLQACKEMAYELDLSFSHLSRYPRGIPDVGKQLELLNLSTNQLPALPEDIGALEGIKECYLQYNCLTRLPDSMCSMLCLQELDIKNNRLTALPDDIGCCRLLKVLALSNNNLRSLPASIGQLHFLEELNVHQNDLLYLPNEICQLSRLKYLYLGKNSLKALPSEFGGLHSLLELDLSDGRLTALPASICQCHSLDKLWLNNNQLRTLPNRLGDLTKLRELHIRSNHLRYIPATVLNMTLYTFTAQDNDFHQEMDLGKASTLDDSPPSSAVPSCQETAARAIIDFGLKWKDGVLPRHLEKYLHQSSYCTRCGGPFLSHCWRQVTFGVVVVTRVPVLHEECSLFCEEYRFEGAPAWPMLGEDDDGDFEDDDRDLDADLMW